MTWTDTTRKSGVRGVHFTGPCVDLFNGRTARCTIDADIDRLSEQRLGTLVSARITERNGVLYAHDVRIGS